LGEKQKGTELALGLSYERKAKVRRYVQPLKRSGDRLYLFFPFFFPPVGLVLPVGAVPHGADGKVIKER
jgi:hypothetical protein